MDLVVLALVNMDNPLDLSEVFLRFRLRNPGLADNWMDVDISRCVKAGKLWRRVSRLDTYLFHLCRRWLDSWTSAPFHFYLHWLPRLFPASPRSPIATKGLYINQPRGIPTTINKTTTRINRPTIHHIDLPFRKERPTKKIPSPPHCRQTNVLRHQRRLQLPLRHMPKRGLHV